MAGPAPRMARRRVLGWILGGATAGSAVWLGRGLPVRWLAGARIPGVSEDRIPDFGGARSEVFIARNGTPQENVARVIRLMGGLDRFIGPHDIVVLKPNAQWWNQGRTNLAAMKGFIDLVLALPGFDGEIIIGENQHFMDTSLPPDRWDDVRGWTHESEINGDIDGANFTLNSLVEWYRARGRSNVSKSHWRDGGPKPGPGWGNGCNGGVVRGPAEGDGYVWADEEYHLSPLLGLKSWKVRMSYPIFTSTYSGITVDLRHGAFRRDGHGGGAHLPDRPVKLVNFPVLNTHPRTGVTSAVKNYMGITDMSCGWPQGEPKGYATVHDCGGILFHHAKAGPIGHFLKTIRRADLNLVTAEWVGYGHRTDPARAVRARAILGGLDPIALDYVGAKRFVLPESKDAQLHDPDRSGSVIRRFLILAAQSAGAGAIGDDRIALVEVDAGV